MTDISATGAEAQRTARAGWPGLFLMTWPFLLGVPILVAPELSNQVLAAGLGTAFAGLVMIRLAEPPSVSVGVSSPLWVGGVWLLLGFVAASILNGSEIMLSALSKVAMILSILMYFGSVVLAFRSSDDGQRSARLRAFLLAFPVFLAVSLVLYFALGQYRDQGVIYTATLNGTLAMLGLRVARTHQIPGITGAASIATVAGIAILGVTHLVRNSTGRLRIVYFALGIPSFIIILMTDTRGAMSGLLIALALYFLANARWTRIIAHGAVIVGAVSAGALYLIFTVLNNTALGSLLIRSNDVGNRLGVGTGRNLIWGAVFRELSKPKSEHFFGYGYFGDLKTHISSDYAWVFQASKNTTSYHNTFLQYTMESGYFSAVLYFVLMSGAVSIIAKAKHLAPRDAKLCMCVVVFFMVGGLTEVVGSVWHFESFLFLLGILAFVGMTPSDKVAADPTAMVRKTPQRRVRLSPGQTQAQA